MLVRQKGSKCRFLIATSSIEQHGHKGRRTPGRRPLNRAPGGLDGQRFRKRHINFKMPYSRFRVRFLHRKNFFPLKLFSAFLIFSASRKEVSGGTYDNGRTVCSS